MRDRLSAYLLMHMSKADDIYGGGIAASAGSPTLNDIWELGYWAGRIQAQAEMHSEGEWNSRKRRKKLRHCAAAYQKLYEAIESGDPRALCRELGIRVLAEELSKKMVAVGAKVENGQPFIVLNEADPVYVQDQACKVAITRIIEQGMTSSNDDYDFIIKRADLG